MKEKYFGSKFYSSILNTVLLFVLIVLMVIALRFMYKNQSVYLPGTTRENESINKTIKTVPVVDGKDQILGNKDDLVAFSIAPGTKVQSVTSYRGVIKGGYFFEGNILINILDSNKNILKKSNATAKTEWATDKNVEFEGSIDFAGLKKGNAYLEIKNDNPSGLTENDKSILIPIIIE